MKEIDRRKFLKVVGVGAGAIAAMAILPKLGGIMPDAGQMQPKADQARPESKPSFAFRAVGGLPAGALPGYATYVLEGHIDPASMSGVVTRTVYAGAPEAMSQIALPGFTRVVRVNGVRDVGALLHARGVVDDRSQLRLGESPTMEFRIDRSARMVHAPFFGTSVPLRVTK